MHLSRDPNNPQRFTFSGSGMDTLGAFTIIGSTMNGTGTISLIYHTRSSQIFSLSCMVSGNRLIGGGMLPSSNTNIRYIFRPRLISN